MTKLFLEDHPTYTGRPVDAERGSLMRDWDEERRAARINKRWKTVRKVGATAMAIVAVAGVGKLLEGSVAGTNDFNQAAAGSTPALVQGQISNNEIQIDSQEGPTVEAAEQRPNGSEIDSANPQS